MKNMPFILSILCFGFMNPVSAQQSQLTLPTALNQQQASSFELINLTGDSTILGYLQINPDDNERRAIVTPVDKKQWLQNTVAAEVAKVVEQDGHSVLYILHDISVGRTATGNYVRLKAAVYAGDDKGYILARRVDTLVADKAKDISSVGDLIATAIISTATGQVGLPAHSPGLSPGPVSALTREEVVRTETERYAFIRRSSTPTGIYMSYEAYKAGKPSFEHFYLKSEGASSSLTVHSFTEADSTLRPVAPWAIAVSNELYFYSDHKLYPVEAVGSNLVFSKFIDPETRKNNAGFWRMTIGDKISGRESNVFDNVNTLIVDNYRNTKLSGEAIKVNADTGKAEW